MQNRIVALAALVATMGASCAHQVVTPPPKVTHHVVLDDAFSSDEQAWIVQGADLWSTAVGPDLTFDYSTAKHDDLLVSPGLDDHELHVIRLHTMADMVEPCLLQAYPFGCYADGRVYLAADALVGYPDFPLRQAACHEFGHALGLAHYDPPTVMAQNTDTMAPAPTPQDTATYCSMHGGCPNHGAAAPR